MDVDRSIGEHVLELLSGIELEHPRVDEERAAERLQAYVEALGLPAPGVRWLPDVRAVRQGRVWPGRDRSGWPSFSGRQWWLLDESWAKRSRWDWRTGLDQSQPITGHGFPAASRIAALDRTALDVGLGSSHYVSGVRRVTSSLHLRGWQLRVGEAPRAPRRVAALIPLAEAAAAGLYAFALGWKSDLVALRRPRLRLDEEGRLHDWDGKPAVDWPGARGLYFWRGVEMPPGTGSDPKKATPGRIASWANAERRRVAIERMGIERFLQGLKASIVQQDDYGRLWRTEREIDGEPFVAVEVVNSTEEPDGSRRRYFLRVPPDVRTARRGVAWTFGLTRRAYAPVAES